MQGNIPTKYGLIWYSTFFLGSWNSHWLTSLFGHGFGYWVLVCWFQHRPWAPASELPSMLRDLMPPLQIGHSHKPTKSQAQSAKSASTPAPFGSITQNNPNSQRHIVFYLSLSLEFLDLLGLFVGCFSEGASTRLTTPSVTLHASPPGRCQKHALHFSWGIFLCKEAVTDWW